ncbi:hypothetical protein ACWCP6_28450 [Streptomyces sp. NPDC002004]
MTTWTTSPFGRRLAALTLAAGLALGAAGCSDGASLREHALSTASQGNDFAPQQGRASAPLAELKGQQGLDLTLTSAERDPAGYLTVRGVLKNDGADTAVVPAELRGSELDVIRTGQSLGGATVVDFAGKKRYYVLRDTDGHPLTTTGLSSLEAGESVRVFMQFPAPPANTRSVGFQMPLFDTATIKISG